MKTTETNTEKKVNNSLTDLLQSLKDVTVNETVNSSKQNKIYFPENYKKILSFINKENLIVKCNENDFVEINIKGTELYRTKSIFRNKIANKILFLKSLNFDTKEAQKHLLNLMQLSKEFFNDSTKIFFIGSNEITLKELLKRQSFANCYNTLKQL